MYMVRRHLGIRQESQTAELNCPSPVLCTLWNPVRFLPPSPMRRFAARPVWQSRVRTFLPMLPYALAAVLGSTDKKNVYGDELVTCSTDGMAMTLDGLHAGRLLHRVR